MRSICILGIVLGSICFCSCTTMLPGPDLNKIPASIQMKQVTNEFLSITIPADWRLDTDIEDKMRPEVRHMSLCLPHEDGRKLVSLWASSSLPKGVMIHPRFLNLGADACYTLNEIWYFLYSQNGEKHLQVITEGDTYYVTAIIPLRSKPETLALVLNSLQTMKPK